MIGFLCAVLFYVIGLRFSGSILNSLSLLGKMTTPLSMMVLGMRLALVPLKPIFATPLFYGTILFKQMIYPIIGGLLISILPFMSENIRITTFILCACPVASIVFNFAEMLGDGQEDAADLFLLGTIGSIVTMPIILLLL
jgi:predicted permease